MALIVDEPKTFLEHLGELRQRLMISILAILVGTFISFWFRGSILGILLLPLQIRVGDLIAFLIDFLGQIGIKSSAISLIGIFFHSQSQIEGKAEVMPFIEGPMESLMMMFKICISVGLLIAAPVVLYQFWMFVLPALKENERRFMIPLFLLIVFFFIFGSCFAFFIATPIALEMFSKLWPRVLNNGMVLENRWMLGRYVSFLIQTLLGFGVAFELPIIMGFIAKLGIVSADGFRSRRRYAWLLIFIAAAVITPSSDALNMTLMALPLLALYELGIWFAMLVGNKPDIPNTEETGERREYV